MSTSLELVFDPVNENGRASYWDRSIMADSTIDANKPDVITADLSTHTGHPFYHVVATEKVKC